MESAPMGPMPLCCVPAVAVTRAAQAPQARREKSRAGQPLSPPRSRQERRGRAKEAFSTYEPQSLQTSPAGLISASGRAGPIGDTPICRVRCGGENAADLFNPKGEALPRNSPFTTGRDAELARPAPGTRTASG